MTRERVELAAELLGAFAVRTGIDADAPGPRYLWTDAFAVCTLLGLARATGDPAHRRTALRLIDAVHATLGRHRDDAPRRGWLSGLAEDDGAQHPTAGGLRIGKPLPERAPGEPFDERLEWERDGQYFHYLTRWMHALDQVTRDTGDARYNRWARELAAIAIARFVSPPRDDRPRALYWKMSVDLSRPLVPTTGQHDALDGYLVCRQLRDTASRTGTMHDGPDLAREIRLLADLVDRDRLATADPLGIGGLLADAIHAAQLPPGDATDIGPLPSAMLRAAVTGLAHYAAHGEYRAPAAHRLAFRELGLAIGLGGLDVIGGTPYAADIDALTRYVPLGDLLTAFWCEPANRSVASWRDHRDINDVMLATSLANDGYLLLPQPPPATEAPAGLA